MLPYFIKIRGCINCDVYDSSEGGAECYYRGCADYNITLFNPFIDIEAQLSFLNRVIEYYPGSEPHVKNSVRQQAVGFIDRFGRFYEELGISLDDLVTSFL
ncbi:hypothetical protein GF352_03605 [archaeon]|nr:hypothetical protein [archaeon]